MGRRKIIEIQGSRPNQLKLTSFFKTVKVQEKNENSSDEGNANEADINSASRASSSSSVAAAAVQKKSSKRIKIMEEDEEEYKAPASPVVNLPDIDSDEEEEDDGGGDTNDADINSASNVSSSEDEDDDLSEAAPGPSSGKKKPLSMKPNVVRMRKSRAKQMAENPEAYREKRRQENSNTYQKLKSEHEKIVSSSDPSTVRPETKYEKLLNRTQKKKQLIRERTNLLDQEFTDSELRELSLSTVFNYSDPKKLEQVKKRHLEMRRAFLESVIHDACYIVILIKSSDILGLDESQTLEFLKDNFMNPSISVFWYVGVSATGGMQNYHKDLNQRERSSIYNKMKEGYRAFQAYVFNFDEDNEESSAQMKMRMESIVINFAFKRDEMPQTGMKWMTLNKKRERNCSPKDKDEAERLAESGVPLFYFGGPSMPMKPMLTRLQEHPDAEKPYMIPFLGNLIISSLIEYIPL